jgi:hypothetical protein
MFSQKIYQMEIPKELNNEIWDYCRVNNITGIDDFIVKLIKQGFTVEKFGATPQSREKIIEKIVQKTIEVPVEKIIEKIVEVPKLIENNEMVEELRLKILESEDLTTKLNQANEKINSLTKELETEKNKPKRDIYGEH